MLVLALPHGRHIFPCQNATRHLGVITAFAVIKAIPDSTICEDNGLVLQEYDVRCGQLGQVLAAEIGSLRDAKDFEL